MTKTTAELLPCPFCGSKDIFISEHSDTATTAIQCINCYIPIVNDSEIKAFKSWNTRVNKEAGFLEELNKELKHKLIEFKADHNVFNWKKVYWNTETLTEYLIKKIEQFQAEQKEK